MLVSSPNPNAPLAGLITFSTDRPVVPTLLIDDGSHQQTVTPDNQPTTEHEILVLGLRPDRIHQVMVTIRDEKGRETALDTLEIETPSLPEDFPPLKLTHNGPETKEPGVTMFDVFRWTGPFDDDPSWGYAIAVDENGEVVWYLKMDTFIGEPRRMHNGNIMFAGHDDGRLYETDMLGNVIRQWHTSGVVIGELPPGSIPVDNDTSHHDVLQLSSGNFLGLGLEVVDFDDFPVEYSPSTKTAPAQVAGDVIIEFAEDGGTLREWSMVEILDPLRLGSGSLNQTFYQRLYKDKYEVIPYDISHTNAIYYIEEEDAVLVSSYQQGIIYKVDMSTGELIWMLGDPEGWKEPWSGKLLKSKGALTWPSHQHGLELTPRGTILIYDNGSTRNIPPQKPLPVEEQYSRAVEFRVDEEAGTVEEVWAYGPEQEHFSSAFICDADHLPETGNILIADGGRMKGPDGKEMNNFGGHQWARIFEVTYGEKKKIWELEVYDPETRFSIYRAQRFRSLYPKLDLKTG
jgi:arylsulfate sulfotransferase